MDAELMRIDDPKLKDMFYEIVGYQCASCSMSITYERLDHGMFLYHGVNNGCVNSDCYFELPLIDLARAKVLKCQPNQ